MLQQAGGKVVSSRELAPGITEVKYSIPGKSYPSGLPTKTIYDPKIYPNVPALVGDASTLALRQYHGTNIGTQFVVVGGVKFEARILVREGVPTVNTIFPIGKGQ